MIYRLLIILSLLSSCESSQNKDSQEAVLEPVFDIKKVAALDDSITESSGIVAMNGSLFTHSDIRGKAKLIEINANGVIQNSFEYENISIRDWEDIAADDDYMYIGDIGNNLAAKTDLKVFKIPKLQMKDPNPDHEIMTFSFTDQTTFNNTEYNETSYDMEALTVIDNTVYVFTKDWLNLNTNVYSFKNTTGTYTLSPLATLNIGGLVTGATTSPEGDIILCGYSPTLSPFVARITIKNGVPEIKRKIDITGMLGTSSQIEGITYFGMSNGAATYYLTSEKFTRNFAGSQIELPANLYELRWNE